MSTGNTAADRKTEKFGTNKLLSVGVPTETKSSEGRVAITPDGVRELARIGASVHVQSGAGTGSSLTDADYRQAGAIIVPTAADAWAQELVVKVKEPQESEFGFLRPDLTLFTYLHLAAYPKVAEALLQSKCTAVAYETVESATGSLPLLAPMSEIAGRLAAQAGARFLERHEVEPEAPQAGVDRPVQHVRGRGVLIGGAPGVRPARVVVLGAGNVGWNAAGVAAGMGGDVWILDKNLERLRFLDQIVQGRMTTIASNVGSIERAVAEADLVIGAVLVPGGRAPIVVTETMVRSMKPGSVIVDVAVDQGGCIETTHETSHTHPVYEQHGVIHYAVGNMPGAVPFTSTYSLTNATLAFVAHISRYGVRAAAQDQFLAPGFNCVAGHITNGSVAAALGEDQVELLEAFG